MSKSNGLPANFTISARAKRAIEDLRRQWNTQVADQAGVLCVAWGHWTLNSGEEGEGVVVTFYGRSELAAVRGGLERVSGMDLVFFITKEDYDKFRDKVLDHDPRRSFFLSDRRE